MSSITPYFNDVSGPKEGIDLNLHVSSHDANIFNAHISLINLDIFHEYC